jgi:hypothetical protein
MARRRWWGLFAIAFVPLVACVDLGTLASSGSDPEDASSDVRGKAGGEAGLNAGDGGTIGVLDGASTDSAKSPNGCNGAVACERVIFVTSLAFIGAFGGVSGADTKCQVVADNATSPRVKGRKFVAWIGTVTQPATTRHVHGSQSYVRTDGLVVASTFQDLTDGLILNSLNADENINTSAGFAWTGTTTSGEPATANCNGWLDSSGVGQTGAVTASSGAWTEDHAASCIESNHLYCIEY